MRLHSSYTQTDDAFTVHVTIVHIYVNERNYHHGNTRRISHRHHHRLLRMSQPLAGRRMYVSIDTEADWQWQQRHISRTWRLLIGASRISDGYSMFAFRSERTFLCRLFFEHPVSLKTTEASRDVHRSHDPPLALPLGRYFGCDFLIVDRSFWWR